MFQALFVFALMHVQTAPDEATTEGREPVEDGRPPPSGVPSSTPMAATPLESVDVPLESARTPSAAPPRPRADPEEVDHRTALLLRVSTRFGFSARTREFDPAIEGRIELGRMHGFSGTFHTTLIPATDRRTVRVLDTPMGLGVVLQGRFRKSLSASIGLSAGILLHRSNGPRGVMHRVDPDFTLPIQFAWTIAGVGIGFAVTQGYSVRERKYLEQGAVVWQRNAYRVGFVFGLHYDGVFAGKLPPPGRKRVSPTRSKERQP